MKLEPKHIVGYLPHRLTCKIQRPTCLTKHSVFSYNVEDDSLDLFPYDSAHVSKVNPLLLPLSKLSEENWKKIREIKQEFFIYRIMANPNPNQVFVGQIKEANELAQYMYSIHADIHGLIDKGLAIDKTL